MGTTKRYAIARTSSGRVTVQHRIPPASGWGYASCGQDLRAYSVAFMTERIPVVACRRPGCKEES